MQADEQQSRPLFSRTKPCFAEKTALRNKHSMTHLWDKLVVHGSRNLPLGKGILLRASLVSKFPRAADVMCSHRRAAPRPQNFALAQKRRSGRETQVVRGKEMLMQLPKCFLGQPKKTWRRQKTP